MSEEDYKKMFSELIHKQILVLGPDITLARVKNVSGITVDPTGQVTSIVGDPQVLLQGLINQFVELSGLIVKKTMESILTNYSGAAALASNTSFSFAQPAGMPLNKQPQQPTGAQQTTPGIAANPKQQVEDLNKMLGSLSNPPQ